MHSIHDKRAKPILLPRNLGKFLPPYRWRFGQVGGFSETWAWPPSTFRILQLPPRKSFFSDLHAALSPWGAPESLDPTAHRGSIGTHRQQFFRSNRELAYPDSGRIVDRVGDRGRRPGDPNFSDSTSAKGIKNRIRLDNEMNVHFRDIRIGYNQIVGEICVRISARFCLKVRALQESHPDSEYDATHNLAARGFQIDDRPDVHHGGESLKAHFARPAIHLQFTELRAERVEGIFFFFVARGGHLHGLHRAPPNRTQHRAEVHAFTPANKLSIFVGDLLQLQTEKR